MKVGGTYGTVIAYQKVGAKAGKKEAAKGKLNSGQSRVCGKSILPTTRGSYLLKDEFSAAVKPPPFEAVLG
jgi:hypothetical protein